MVEGENNQQSTLFNSPGGETNTDSSSQVLLEEVHSDAISLSYTYFLIPEDPSFQLIDELVELLPIGLKEICDSNGWKLEFVTVDPSYFQWALSVPTVVATTQVIKQVRAKSTEQMLSIIKDPTTLRKSTDLWAEGYLVLYGLHPYPAEVVQRYIRLIRDQQQEFSE